VTEVPPAYGLWGLALANSAVVTVFAASFVWRSGHAMERRAFGGFAVFVAALFAEMYGFPLSLHLVLPLVEGEDAVQGPLVHADGHLWWVLFGADGTPDGAIPHTVSLVVIVAGFALLASAWAALDAAGRDGIAATRGPYAHIRHPQYAALVLIMLGLMLRGPTLPTAAMFPILALFYVQLAKDEEHWTAIAYGGAYSAYLAATPRWLPRLRRIARG